MAWPENLPLLLAGPIVRRVEPGLASVWVAVSSPGTVELRLWQGVVDAGTGDGVFEGPPPLASGSRATRAIGRRLHTAVVTVTGTEDDPLGLRPDRTYSYDVTVSPETGTTVDLRSLGLLDADRAPPGPLGYTPGLLPSFALPPPDLTDLSVVHGSCRMMTDANDPGPDALPWLDRVIERHHGEPRERPHQLYLTGDQIYADHVAVAVLPTLTALGNELLGLTEKVPVEGEDWRVDHEHLPTGWRTPVIEGEARFTGLHNDSHLVSLGEFCAMYLLAWSPDVWPEDGRVPPGVDEDTLYRFPGEGGGGPSNEKRALLMDVSEATVDALDNVGCGGSREDLSDDVREDLERVCDHREALGERLEKEKPLVDRYRAGVGAVRRALANVPTYMVFDDHEITDDWYITRRWVERVTGSPLGRTVLRNGLLAYALFQGEGNDPLLHQDADGEPPCNAELLQAAAELVPDGDAEDFRDEAERTLRELLGLGEDPPKVRWSYQVPGTRHHTIVLDTRTRRAFGGETAPPALVAPDAVDEQVPEGPLPAGVDVLLVVSAAPVLGMPVIESIGGSIYAAYNNWQYRRGKTDRPGHLDPDRESWAHEPVAHEALLRRLASYPRVVLLSGDVHYGMSAALTYWDAAGTPSRMVQLTSSGTCNAWRRSVSSAVLTLAPAGRLLEATSTVEHLAWEDARPPPISVPDDVVVHPAVRFRLNRAPVLVHNHGWPAGARMERDPDWAWRLEVLADPRPVEELPEAARPVLREDVDPTLGFEAYDAVTRRHGANLAAVTNSPRMVWLHNLGLVSFAEDAEDLPGLSVRHDLLSRHPRGEPPDTPDVYTSHRATLDTDEARPEELAVREP